MFSMVWLNKKYSYIAAVRLNPGGEVEGFAGNGNSLRGREEQKALNDISRNVDTDSQIIME